MLTWLPVSIWGIYLPCFAEAICIPGAFALGITLALIADARGWGTYRSNGGDK